MPIKLYPLGLFFSIMSFLFANPNFVKIVFLLLVIVKLVGLTLITSNP